MNDMSEGEGRIGDEKKRTFVGTLFELLVLSSLIDEFQKLISRKLSMRG